MNERVAEILESPRLPEIVEELRARLEEERQRRARFYAEVSEGVKAEFINGEIIMHSPAKVRHLKVRDRLLNLLLNYVLTRQLGWVTGEKALCVFPRNDYEPDVCYFGPEKAAHLQPDQLKLPIPDFIAEVLSDSTEATDRGQKLDDYQAHAVGEYWIVDPDREILEQYLLQGGRYTLVQKSGTGEVRSAVVPGFCVPVRSLFDAQVHLTALRELLNAAPS